MMQQCVKFRHLILVVAVATSAQIAKANLNVEEKQIILDLFNYLRALHHRNQLVRGLHTNSMVICLFIFSAMGD